MSLVWAVVLSVFVSACGASSDQQEGVLPGGEPEGEVVALDVGAPGGALLKAYARALYRSRDGGESWQAVPLPAPVQEGRIVAVATPPGAEGTLYIAGPGFGIFRSTDGGKTWAPLNAGLPNLNVYAFATHAELERTLYAVVEGAGVLRTEDGGESWKRMDDGPLAPIRQLVHSNFSGSMETGWLYAATPTRVHRSMDCFCGWREAGSLSEAGELYGIAFDPEQPAHMYAAAAGGVFVSRDAGETWERASMDGPEKVVLAFDPAAGVLYAATPEGAVLRSADQGSSWERVGA